MESPPLEVQVQCPPEACRAQLSLGAGPSAVKTHSSHALRSSQPGTMPDGLLARLVGTAYDDLEALVVVEEAAVEFGLDGAVGGGPETPVKPTFFETPAWSVSMGWMSFGMGKCLGVCVDSLTTVLWHKGGRMVGRR